MKTAKISPCGTYRYNLTRRWDEGGKTMLFVMLNPSTADADVDDPTIRRCVGFAKRDGYSAIEVVNLYAFRATDPDRLFGVSIREIIGPDNNEEIRAAAQRADRVVAAWGAGRHATFTDGGAGRWRVVAELIKSLGKPIYCLNTSASGQPRHPLYVRADQPLLYWMGP